VLTSVVSNIISVAAIILVALVMGFDSSAGVLSWLAGLSAKTVEGASVFSYPLIFLPFISSAFVSTETMPSTVCVFAENQPVTSIVETIRSLLSSQPVGNEIWVALAWCVGILFVAYVFAVRTIGKQLNLNDREGWEVKIFR